MWKKIKFKRGVLSTVLVLGLLLTNFSPLGISAKESENEQTAVVNENRVKAQGGEQKAAVELKWDGSYLLSRTVRQGDKTIQSGGNEATGIINPNKDFRVSMKVKLPVAEGKASRPYLKKNDFIRIPMIGKGVKVNGTSDLGKIDAKFLVDGAEQTVKQAFSAKVVADETTKTVYMVMTLLVDNKELKDAVDLTADIKMDFSVDQSGIGKDNGRNYIYSEEKKIYLGKFDNKFVVEKTGTIDYDKGNIDWTVKVEKIGDIGEKTSLAGYKFEDPIGKVGAYIPETFTVCEAGANNTLGNKIFADNGSASSDFKYVTGATDAGNNNALTYVFPDNAPGKAIVKFSTSLNNNDDYSSLRNGFSKDNTAYLYQKEENGNKYSVKVAEDTTTVRWNGMWGVKYHGGYAQKNGIRDALLKDHLSDKGMTDKSFAELDEGIKVESGKHKVQWDIVFDATDKNLTNVKLRDPLPLTGRYSKKEMTFDKAMVRKWDVNGNKWLYFDYANKTWGTVKYITTQPEDGRYEIGDLNTVAKLTIWSEVVGLKGIDRFSNNARVMWGKDSKKYVVLSEGINLGNKSIIKRAESYYIESNPKWNIKVSKTTVDENKAKGIKTYVYDALIDTSIGDTDAHYKLINGTSDDKVAARGNFSLENGEKQFASGVKLADIVYQAGTAKMSYEDGSFADSLNNGALKATVHTLYYTKDTQKKAVGKILEVTGFEDCKKTLDDEGDKWYPFSFRTNIVDADTLTGGSRRDNDSDLKYNQVMNLAYLYGVGKVGKNGEEGVEYESFSDYWANYNHRMIQKDALTSEAAEKLIAGGESSYTAANANDVVKDTSGAYAKDYKSVVFRLSVNAENMKKLDTSKLEAFIKDSIDSKFKIVSLNDKDKYLVFKGTPRTAFTGKDYTKDAYVIAEGSPVDANDIFTVNENVANGDKLDTTFTLKKLDAPYVILLRAQIRDGENGDEKKIINSKGAVTNAAIVTLHDIRFDGTKGKDYSLSSSKSVDYDTRFLSKEYKVEQGGIIRWAIEYNPSIMDAATKKEIEDAKDDSAADKEDITLYDILENGLSVFSENGKPILGKGYYSLEMVGKDGNSVQYSDKLTDLLSYNKEGGKEALTLKIPNNERMNKFIFSYSTILDKNTPKDIKNTVQIRVAGEKKSEAEVATYTVSAGVSLDTFVMEGNLTAKIVKTDAETGRPIKGVVFELTSPNGKVQKTETDVTGVVKFSSLTEGKGYKLRELSAEGYEVDKNTYVFNVEQITVPNGKTLTIGGFTVEGTPVGEQQLKFGDGVVGGSDGRTIIATNKRIGELKDETSFNLIKADYDVNKDVITKAGVTVNEIKSRLDGVKFTLTSGSSVVSEGTTSSPAGIVTFEGLASGKYTLKEASAKAGYKALDKTYTVVVTTAAINKAAGKDAKDEIVVENKDENVGLIDGNIVVLNHKENVTPNPVPGPNPSPNPNPGPNPSPNPNPNPNPNPGPSPSPSPNPGPNPSPNPGPNPGPNPSPNPSPSPSPNPNPTPKVPTTDIPNTDTPTYPSDNFPNPNDPKSPDEFISVDENGTPKGKYVKKKKPDGTNEYVKVDEDGTPEGVNKPKNGLPKTGGSNNVVYYLGGAMLIFLASGIIVRRRKYN